MTLGSWLIAFALLLLVGLYLARPFLTARRRPADIASVRQQLLAQKEALLIEIQALIFDYETGKLPEDLYQQQRSQLVLAAARILRRLDTLPADVTPVDQMEAEIEAAIAERRQQLAPAETAAHYCIQCGEPLAATDRFCANCGHPVAAVESST